MFKQKKAPQKGLAYYAIQALKEARGIDDENKSLKINSHPEKEFEFFIEKFIKRNYAIIDHAQIIKITEIARKEAEKFIQENKQKENTTDQYVKIFLENIKIPNSITGIAHDNFNTIIFPLILMFVQYILSKKDMKKLTSKIENIENELAEIKELVSK